MEWASRTAMEEAHRRFVQVPVEVRHDERISDVRAKLRAELFGPQLAFFDDPSRQKAALCTRRAGKTEGEARDSLDGGLCAPARNMLRSVYIAITRERAKDLLWGHLKAINFRLQLGMKANEQELTMTLPEGLGGSVVKLTGADKAKEIEKRRGDKLRRVRIDEAQTFGDYLKPFVEDVLDPALMDLQGDLGLLGTPGPVCAGFFYDVTRNEDAASVAKRLPGWAVHSWSVLDNPHMPHARAEITAKKAARGWDDLHPTYLREWCGRWVNDAGALFYRYDPTRNTYKELPAGHRWFHVVGIDLGFDDAFSYVVWAFARTCRELYEVETRKRAELLPSQWAKLIDDVRARYSPQKMVIDQGGLGKSFAEEMRQRHKLPVEAAQKSEKYTYATLLNDDLTAGLIKVRPESALAKEWALLPKDPDDPTKEDPRFDNHAADAGLYGWREARHFVGKVPEPKPEPGSTAALQAEADRKERDLERRVRQQMRDEREEASLW
jgi:hypothetical protein